MKRSIFFATSIIMLFSTQALASGLLYPGELRGKYLADSLQCKEKLKLFNDGIEWSGPLIFENGVQYGTEMSCELKNIVKTGISYKAQEQCFEEGEEGDGIKRNVLYTKNNNKLTVNIEGTATIYTDCDKN